MKSVFWSGLLGVAAQSSSGGLRARAAIVGLVCVTACGRDVGTHAPNVGSEPATTKFMARPASPPVGDVEGPQNDSDELRRGYGAVDMRFEPCVVRESDYVLKGTNCGAGILIYGPYVSVPLKSQIEIAFDVESDQPIHVYTDTVSQMGNRVLAGLNPLLLAGGQNHRVGYFVNVAEPEANVESRIGFSANGPLQFVVSNLTMTVR